MGPDLNLGVSVCGLSTDSFLYAQLRQDRPTLIVSNFFLLFLQDPFFPYINIYTLITKD